MKKIVFLIHLLLIMSGINAKNIKPKVPAKLLYGIITDVDNMDNTVTYYSKNCCLSLVYYADNDSTSLNLALSCTSPDVPLSVQKLVIKTGNITKVIDAAIEEFEENSITQRYSTDINRISAEYKTRIFYNEIWRRNALDYMDIIQSLINNQGYARFYGVNGKIDIQFKKQDSRNMRNILNLY